MAESNAIPASVFAAYSQAVLSPTNRLLVDYVNERPAAQQLFPHLPAEISHIARNARSQADRTALADTLVAFQQQLGAAAPAVEAARLLADPTTPVITVGQQTGLLTGPLYTIYKAISAITTAQSLARELDRPVVPVFWTATDDDDRGEADHCAFWDQHQQLHTIRYPESAGQKGELIGNLPAGQFGEEVLGQLTSLIAGCPYAEEVEDLLHSTLAASGDMGTWCCRLLSALFSQFGMVVCDPRLPGVRRLAAEVLHREFAQPLATTNAINTRATELRRLGYRPQLTKPADVCNAFFLDETRQRICYRDGHFSIAQQSYTPEDMMALLADYPERFMPNAVLRPVVQEYLFGSSAFIAGPNELCYWAELSPVFSALNIAMPPVLPRVGGTIVPRQAGKCLRQWEIAPGDLFTDFHQVRFAVLGQLQPESIQQGFVHGRMTIEALLADIVARVSPVEPTLAQSALATHQRMLNELERLEHKSLKAVERKSADVMARLDACHTMLFPSGGLQERSLNIFSVLAQYGQEVIAQLLVLLAGQEGQHFFVEL